MADEPLEPQQLPAGVSSPTRRFVITRLDGVTETNVVVSAMLPPNFTTDQPMRSDIIAQAEAMKAAEPGTLFRVYSPSNSGPHTSADCCWRSDIEYG
jgi:hypothetical protein